MTNDSFRNAERELESAVRSDDSNLFESFTIVRPGMRFGAISPSRLSPKLTATTNSSELRFASPDFRFALAVPGYHEQHSIPLLTLNIRSPVASISYISEEKKTHLSVSPHFGSLPLTLTVRPFDSFRSTFGLHADLPLDLPFVDLSVSARCEIPNPSARLSVNLAANLPNFRGTLSAATIVANTAKLPSVTVSTTFGLGDLFWGAKGAYDLSQRKFRIAYASQLGNQTFRVRGRYETDKGLTGELLASFRDVKCNFGFSEAKRAEFAVLRYNGEGRKVTLAVDSERKIVAKVKWPFAKQHRIGFSASYDALHRWKHPLFGAFLTIGASN